MSPVKHAEGDAIVSPLLYIKILWHICTPTDFYDTELLLLRVTTKTVRRVSTHPIQGDVGVLHEQHGVPLLAHDESRRGWFSQQSHPLQTAASLLVSLRSSVSLTVAHIQRLYLWTVRRPSPLRT